MSRHPRLPVLLWALLAVAAALLFARQLVTHWPGPEAGIETELQRLIMVHTMLPRAAVALFAGAVLGLSGLLLQRILRNPLAEPSTLGISAGAQLAMAMATLNVPVLMEYSPGLVAFMGGMTAVALILALTWRRGLEPVSVVLSGMMVALTANALSAALILANGDYLFSLFIWGGGSLVQQGWDPTISIGLRLVAGLAAAMLLLRPLAILGLDDASARNLGVAMHTSRFLVIALAVWMATSVVAKVGVIGFVGLAAPALATLSSARTLKQKLVVVPLIGAIVLWLTDGLVQLLAGSGGERIPTGAATALLGGPLLLWLLPRLRLFERPSLQGGGTTVRRAAYPVLLLAGLGACCMIAALVALLLGRDYEGWSFATGDLLRDLAEWRVPRIAVATAAGGMLAAAGVAIQRITANPLSSPEVLGVGTGAGAGLAAVLMVTGTTELSFQIGGSAAGALLALAVILAVGARGQLGPERLLFAGIAINALFSSILTAVIALGNAQSYVLLGWLSGSTNDATGTDALIAITGLLILIVPLLMTGRWLDILPLGAASARALGVSVRPAQLFLILLSALATALAAIFVGPLSFVGLIAPHLARLLGVTKARDHLIGAVFTGMLLMIASDWLSRMVAFPYQLPVGLFASMLGGIYLVYLLGTTSPRRA